MRRAKNASSKREKNRKTKNFSWGAKANKGRGGGNRRQKGTTMIVEKNEDRSKEGNESSSMIVGEIHIYPKKSHDPKLHLYHQKYMAQL